MHKNIFIFLFLLINIFNSLSLIAQKKTIALSLDDVVLLAHHKSDEAMIAKHQFLSKYWQYRSFKADYLPAVSISGTLPSISRSIRKVETIDGDVFVSSAQNSYNARISINQKIGFTGGRLSIITNLNRNDNLNESPKTISYNSTPISINYNQPLFKFNPFKWERITEPVKYEKAKKEYLENLEDISLRATQQFFELLISNIRVEIAKKNYARYDTLYKVAKGRYNLGKYSESEVLSVELQFLDNQLSVSETKLAHENVMFKFKSFLRLNTDEEIQLIIPDMVDDFEINIEEAIKYAKENTSAAIKLELNEIETEKSLEEAKMAKRPNIDLSANYGLNNYAGDLKEAYIDPSISTGLTISLSMPLIDWGRKKGRFKMAESNYIINKTTQKQNRIDFEQDIKLKVLRFLQLNNQLIIAKKRNEIATKNFDLIQKRFLIGKINDVLELNQAQISNDNANISYLSAIEKYWTEYYRLRKLTLYDFIKKQYISTNFDDII